MVKRTIFWLQNFVLHNANRNNFLGRTFWVFKSKPTYPKVFESYYPSNLQNITHVLTWTCSVRIKAFRSQTWLRTYRKIKQNQITISSSKVSHSKFSFKKLQVPSQEAFKFDKIQECYYVNSNYSVLTAYNYANVNCKSNLFMHYDKYY